jgi:hypothetical protein
MPRRIAFVLQRAVALHAPLLLALVLVWSSAAQAQVSMRVRGTISALEGNVLSVKTREGRDLKLVLSDKLVVVAAKALKLEDLAPGEYVGATTQARADGARVALELHTLPASAQPGHFAWDLKPDSMMTNGSIEGTVAKTAAGQQITLKHKEGSQTIVVPPGTPVVTNTPADRSALKPGEYIFSSAAVGADGTMTVERIQVSRDGVRPPQ